MRFRTRVVAGIVGPIVAAGLLIVMVGPKRRMRDAHVALRDKAALIARMVEHSFDRPIQNGEALTAHLQRAIAADVGLAAVFLHTPQGPLGAQGAGPRPIVARAATPGVVLQTREHLVVSFATSRGTLEVVVSTSPLAEAKARAYLDAVMIAILMITITSFATLILVRRITTPVTASVGAVHDEVKRLAEVAAAQQAAMIAALTHVESIRSLVTRFEGMNETVASHSAMVLSNADDAHQGAAELGITISATSKQAGALTAKLEAILELAERSDVLALNAGLEGSRVGEAGAGFMLLASEMRRLAEHSQAVVASCRSLIDGVQLRSTTMAAASQASQALIAQTGEAARAISSSTVFQRELGESAVSAMHELVALLQGNLAQVTEVTRAAQQLTVVARQLADIGDA